MRAGRGKPGPFLRKGKDAADASDYPYLKVEVVRWFVYKDSTYRTEKMAVGSVELAIGNQKFEHVLGPFWLKGDSYDAPVFNKAIVSNFRYGGEPIEIKTFLFVRPRDTAFMNILEGLAEWGLNVGGSLVQTAASPVVSTILSLTRPPDANTKLWASVQQTLRSERTRQEECFDLETGISHTLDPGRLRDSDVYLLLHRGSEIPEGHLLIDENQAAPYPMLIERAEGDMGRLGRLNDGAWVLLRFRRSRSPVGSRQPWKGHIERWENSLKALLLDVKNKGCSPQSALEQLAPAPAGSANAYEQYRVLREVILYDDALAQHDRDSALMKLEGSLDRVRAAIGAMTGKNESLTAGPEKTRRPRSTPKRL